MRVTIVPDDKIVVVDGAPIKFDFSIDSTIHAVQWDGQKGHIEFKSTATDEKGVRKPNLAITDINDFKEIIGQYATEKARVQAEREAASAQADLTKAKAEEKRKPINESLSLLKTKLVGKTLTKISDAEALEFVKIQMAEFFGLEVK